MNIWHIALQGCLRSGSIQYGVTADTGGHIKYLLDLVAAIEQVDSTIDQTIVTRRFTDRELGTEYASAYEKLSPRSTILRVRGETSRYLPKEEFWTETDTLVSGLQSLIEESGRKPDLIHAHYADAGGIAARLKSEMGIPFFFSGHSLGRVKQVVSSDSIGDVESFLFRVGAEEQALQSADVTIASSRNEVEEQLGLYENYDPASIRILPPGTTIRETREDLKDQVRSRLHRFLYDPDLPIVLAVARPVQRKNLPALVKAFAGNESLRRRANLVIVAGCREKLSDLNPEQEHEMCALLRAVDDHDLYGSVALPKSHDESEVASFYEVAAESGGVFVNTAVHEPFGLTLLEATAMGMPSVATRNGGPSDILAQCRSGLLVDPENDREVGDAIAEIIGDKRVWEKFSCAAREAAPGLTWEHHARQYLDLAGLVCKERSRNPALRQVEAGLICADIDNTLTGEIDSLRSLQKWLDGNPSLRVVISTGRRFDDALVILKRWGIECPEFLITSVGSEIYQWDLATGSYQQNHDWPLRGVQEWPVDKISAVLSTCDGLQRQRSGLQRKFKLGYLVNGDAEEAVEAAQDALDTADLDCTLVFSHNLYLDVLPPGVDKGGALAFVQQQLKIDPARTIAAGDSLNDKSMLEKAACGIVVANGALELDSVRSNPAVYFSSQRYAAGVLEGLELLKLDGWDRFPSNSER